jgi:hypothetical protein
MKHWEKVIVYMMVVVGLTITNMSIYAFDMREISRIFITYTFEGTFKMENCMLRIAEPFTQWVSEGNSWNATFVNISKGTFQFRNVDFVNITVNRPESCVIFANISKMVM